MGIFERMGRVASANFNALLDRADSPEKSLELTLHEMREQLRAARREVVRSVAAEKQLGSKVADLAREITRWEERAELAVRSEKDELARAALGQKRRLVTERDRTEALRIQQLQEALEMKAELERMERKLEDFSSRKGTIAAMARQAASGSGPEGLASGGSETHAAWHEMEDRLDNIDAVMEAQREVDAELARSARPGGMSQAEVEAEFQRLERGSPLPLSERAPDDLDQELSALKRKYRIGG